MSVQLNLLLFNLLMHVLFIIHFILNLSKENHTEDSFAAKNAFLIKIQACEINRFTYSGNNISSTETGVNTMIVKVWTVLERVSIIRKSDHSDIIKKDFFQAMTVSILLYG